MKNLWNVVTGSANATPEDIARAVVDMERKIEGFERDVKIADQEALQLSKMKICGEKVRDEDIDLADRKVTAAKRNLKAAQDTLQELGIKLKEAVNTKIISDKEGLEQKRRALKEKKKKLNDAFIRMFVQLKALSIALNGSIVQHTPVGCEPQNEEDKSLYHQELTSALSQQEKPTYYEEERQLEHISDELKQRKSEEVIEELLKATRNTN